MIKIVLRYANELRIGSVGRLRDQWLVQTLSWKVMEVIDESTERVQYSQWVSSLLEIEPLGLDGARVQDIFDVDGKSHRIIIEPSRAAPPLNTSIDSPEFS